MSAHWDEEPWAVQVLRARHKGLDLKPYLGRPLSTHSLFNAKVDALRHHYARATSEGFIPVAVFVARYVF